MKPAAGALCLAMMVGCVQTGRPIGDGPFADSHSRPNLVRIVVQNRNFADARLFAIRDGGRRTLGSVGGKQDRTFTIDWNYTQSLQIEIDLLAGPTCWTETLTVQPGDILELQIQPVFNESSFCR